MYKRFWLYKYVLAFLALSVALLQAQTVNEKKIAGFPELSSVDAYSFRFDATMMILVTGFMFWVMNRKSQRITTTHSTTGSTTRKPPISDVVTNDLIRSMTPSSTLRCRCDGTWNL